jgi:hypothetical protein
MPTVFKSSFSFSLSPEVLWWTLFACMLLFLIMGVVFVYHWRTYSYRSGMIKAMGITYFVGGILILGLLGIVISSYAAAI